MRTFLTIIVFCLLLAPVVSPVAATDKPGLFGQTAPGVEPQPFAGNFLSADKYPHGQLSFSPDGTTAFWSAMPAEGPQQTIFFSTFDGKVIFKPVKAPFAADSGNGGPVFSSDGKRIYFNADLPRADSTTAATSAICYVDKTDAGWSEPVVIEASADTTMIKGQVTVTRNGNVYFTGRVRSERHPNIWMCEFVNGQYQPPKALTGPISSLPLCVDPWVDPDENFMLVSYPPGGDLVRTDIGISHRQPDGTWSLPVSIGGAVNTDAFERFPTLSPCGKYLFFIRSTSERFVGPGAHFYWVEASILDSLKR